MPSAPELYLPGRVDYLAVNKIPSRLLSFPEEAWPGKRREKVARVLVGTREGLELGDEAFGSDMVYSLFGSRTFGRRREVFRSCWRRWRTI